MPKFQVSENVLCFHGPLLYPARINKLDEAPGEDSLYFVHYLGWKKKWDEWVFESRMMKLTPENSAHAEALRKEISGKQKKSPKKQSKTSRASNEAVIADSSISDDGPNNSQQWDDSDDEELKTLKDIKAEVNGDDTLSDSSATDKRSRRQKSLGDEFLSPSTSTKKAGNKTVKGRLKVAFTPAHFKKKKQLKETGDFSGSDTDAIKREVINFDDSGDTLKLCIRKSGSRSNSKQKRNNNLNDSNDLDNGSPGTKRTKELSPLYLSKREKALLNDVALITSNAAGSKEAQNSAAAASTPVRLLNGTGPSHESPNSGSDLLKIQENSTTLSGGRKRKVSTRLANDDFVLLTTSPKRKRLDDSSMKISSRNDPLISAAAQDAKLPPNFGEGLVEFVNDFIPIGNNDGETDRTSELSGSNSLTEPNLFESFGIPNDMMSDDLKPTLEEISKKSPKRRSNSSKPRATPAGKRSKNEKEKGKQNKDELDQKNKRSKKGKTEGKIQGDAEILKAKLFGKDERTEKIAKKLKQKSIEKSRRKEPEKSEGSKKKLKRVTGYILWYQNNIKQVLADLPKMKFAEISQHMSNKWKNEVSDVDKSMWSLKATKMNETLMPPKPAKVAKIRSSKMKRTGMAADFGEKEGRKKFGRYYGLDSRNPINQKFKWGTQANLFYKRTRNPSPIREIETDLGSLCGAFRLLGNSFTDTGQRLRKQKFESKEDSKKVKPEDKMERNEYTTRTGMEMLLDGFVSAVGSLLSLTECLDELHGTNSKDVRQIADNCAYFMPV